MTKPRVTGSKEFPSRLNTWQDKAKTFFRGTCHTPNPSQCTIPNSQDNIPNTEEYTHKKMLRTLNKHTAGTCNHTGEPHKHMWSQIQMSAHCIIHLHEGQVQAKLIHSEKIGQTAVYLRRGQGGVGIDFKETGKLPGEMKSLCPLVPVVGPWLCQNSSNCPLKNLRILLYVNHISTFN